MIEEAQSRAPLIDLDEPCPVDLEEFYWALDRAEALLAEGDAELAAKATRLARLIKLRYDRWHARRDFIYFVRLVRPDLFIGKHHRLLAKAFERIRDGDLTRLMVFMPPGHTKSLFASILLPAWLYGMRPSGRVLATSHSIDLVEDFSREIRDVIKSEEYRRLFPDVGISSTVDAARRWQTTAGGKYVGAGVGARIAGKRADLLAIIDDPISEQDAYSEARLVAVNRWYPGGFRTRLLPGTPVVLMMTRWQPHDPAGHLLANASVNMDAEQWEVIKLPMILTEESAKTLNTVLEPGEKPARPGDALFPELFPLREAKTLKAEMPPAVWAAVYDQEPTIAGGNIIKAEWWRPWPAHKAMPEIVYLVHVWDTGYEDTELVAFSACTIWGVFFDPRENQYAVILLGRYRERKLFPDLRRDAKELYEKWNARDHGGPVDAVLIEPKASGKSLIQELQRAGVPAFEWAPERVGGREVGKIVRAHAGSVVPYSGGVYYPEGKRWAEEIIDHCAQFPGIEFVDDVDTCTMAWIWLRRNWWIPAKGDRPVDDDDDERPAARAPLYG